MAQGDKVRQLKDYEILGAGASRREAAVALSATGGAVELWTYPELVPAGQKGLYEILLQDTIRWLQPSAVRSQKLSLPASEFLVEALLEELKTNFPQTSNYLRGGLRELLKDYLREVPWQGPLISSHFRYWPVFLKRHFQDSRLYLISQKEWLWSYLSFADFAFPPPEPGRVVVNPSLQSLYTTTEVTEVGLTPGLLIFYYDYATHKIRELKMDLWQAAVVDLLQEDRKYTLDQLLDQLLLTDLDQPLDRDRWQKKLSNLIAEGIILVSGSGWNLNCKK